MSARLSAMPESRPRKPARPKSVRIFYDHQVSSLQDAGGVSRYFFQIAQALLQFGAVQPDFILGLQHSVVPFRTLPLPARVLAISSNLRPGYQRYAVNEAITASIVPFRGEYDIYHATYQRLLPYVRRRAVVVTHHDSTTDRYPHLFPDAAAIHARLKKVYAGADRILCISESSRQDLLHYYDIAAEKTEVIHHGFSPLPEGAQSDAVPFEGRPFLLYVGARAAYKNFPIVLEALARQGETLCLLVLGGGSFSAGESRQIDRLHLAGRIHLVPRASDTQLAAAYRTAALFLYPSLYEGFGFPPLEAMHAGCPAVVSGTSALPEICGDAAFYFDPADVDELADLIRSLLDDRGLRLSKRGMGLAQVRRYSWERAAHATLAAYRKAVDSR